MKDEWSEAERRLRKGIADLAISIPADVPAQLIVYLQELLRWNRAYNLTAVKDPLDMVPRHLLDSLAVMPHLHGDRVIDIGSGAGLPGIPLALADTRRHFTLLDSNGKKAAFLRHVTRHLRLENTAVIDGRAEVYGAGEGAARFDTVLNRAFAGVQEMLHAASGLCAAGGRIVAMRGKAERRETAAVATTSGFQEPTIVPLTIPGLAAERHLLIFSRQ